MQHRLSTFNLSHPFLFRLMRKTCISSVKIESQTHITGKIHENISVFIWLVIRNVSQWMLPVFKYLTSIRLKHQLILRGPLPVAFKMNLCLNWEIMGSLVIENIRDTPVDNYWITPWVHNLPKLEHL